MGFVVTGIIKKLYLKNIQCIKIRFSHNVNYQIYRRNPLHRTEMAHPGDGDYRLPSYAPPPAGTPPCPFGQDCYRRNPVHFQQFSHPPSS